MSVWWSLVRKEFRFNLNLFLMMVVFLLLLEGIHVLIAISPLQIGDMYGGITIFLIPSLLFPILMFISLHKEWNSTSSQLWLNIPQSGFKLLSAKYVVVSLQMLALTVLLTVVAFYNLNPFDLKPYFGEQGTSNEFILFKDYGLFWSVWVIFINGAQLAITVLFIYILAKSIRKIGWLIGIILTKFISGIFFMLMDTAAYKSMAQWGMLKVITVVETWGGSPINPTITSVVSSEITEAIYLGEVILTIGTIILYLLLSSWLFERKVEV
jgi:hypothetical protein